MRFHLSTVASSREVCVETLGSSSPCSWLKWRPQTRTGSRSSSPQSETTLPWRLFSWLSWGKFLCRRLQRRPLSGSQAPWLWMLLDVRRLKAKIYELVSGGLMLVCFTLSRRCLDLDRARRRAWCVVFSLIWSFTLIYNLPRLCYLIRLSSHVYYSCVNGIKYS